MPCSTSHKIRLVTPSASRPRADSSHAVRASWFPGTLRSTLNCRQSPCANERFLKLLSRSSAAGLSECAATEATSSRARAACGIHAHREIYCAAWQPNRLPIEFFRRVFECPPGLSAEPPSEARFPLPPSWWSSSSPSSPLSEAYRRCRYWSAWLSLNV